MILITDICQIPPIDRPCGLTIGSFDGVHLGHQALLHRLRSKLPSEGLLAVFTFSNHPSHYFTPHAPIPLITPPLQKAQLLKELGADIAILTPFTPEFSKTCFDEFLRTLKSRLSFSYLVLGSGATFGKHKEGNEANVRNLCSKLSFEVEYLPKLSLQGAPISSGRIRALISQGAFHEAKAYLGRPYSLMCHLSFDKGQYSTPVKGLCLPPEGIYPVQIKTASRQYLGRAHIDHKEHQIHLELSHGGEAIDSTEAEVIFSS
jgi:riboflavin kinase/FMN adenylyltransferase